MSDYRDQVFPGQEGASGSRRIVLEFESFRDFIQAFSPQVSEEGMFVAGEFLPDGLPQAGEEVSFEVRLSDDFRLVQGRGEVAWVRESDVEREATGAAIRFIDLDEPSRRLVSRLVSNFEKDGGKPFALAGPASVGLDAVEPEVLDRGEADELFASDIPGSISEQEELDSVAPLEVPLEEPAEEFAEKAAREPAEELAGEPARELAGEHVEEPVLSEAEFGLTPESLEDVSIPGLEEPAAASLDDEPRLDVPEFDLETAAASDGLVGAGVDGAEGDPVDQATDLTPPLDLDVSLDGLDEGLNTAAEVDASQGAAAPVISDDIAQIAEELSGIHKVDAVEMPTEDQLTFAGAAQAKEGRGPWRALLFASLAGIALGVAAWFFAGDQLKGWIGLGGDESVAVAESGDQLALPASSAAGSEDEIVESGDSQEMPVAAEPEAASEEAGPSEQPAAGAAEQSQPAEQPRPSTTLQREARVERPAAQAAGLSRIEQISWDERDGETVVAIRFDGAVSDESYEVVRIREGAPREVIKVFGVSSPYSPNQLTVGSAQVARLRTGIHGEEGSKEIHIVADLTGPAAAVTLVRTSGSTLLVTFS